MAVVIRLQGLRVTAGSEDIRKFFTGLKIPDGGVHIIGGEREEAFIIFASDEDARRAMTRSGGFIRGMPVTLLLSSRTEMQNMLEESTKVIQGTPKKFPEENSRRIEVDSSKGARRPGHPEPGRRTDSTPPRFQSEPSDGNETMYVFLKGLPFEVTETEIIEFFSGLLVDDIFLFKNPRGQNNGKGLVKFATCDDASEGLKRDKEYIGSRYVDVYAATEKQWRAAGRNMTMGPNDTSSFERGRFPERIQRNPQHGDRSRSPLGPGSSSSDEFCVFLENLPFGVDNEDIKRFLQPARIEADQILHMSGNSEKKSRSAFVLFKTLRDYCAAITHHNEEFLNKRISITTVTREKMIAIMKSSKMSENPPGNFSGFQERPSSQPKDSYDTDKICLYVRNLPFDVRKVEIIDFFLGYNITEDKVILLVDNRGAGLGEALVLFQSERDAANAQSLNGHRFLGSEVMLKCISRSQIRQFGVSPPKVQESQAREDKFSSWGSEAPYRSGGRHPNDGSIPMSNQHGGRDYNTGGPRVSQYRSNGSGRDGFGSSGQNFDGPTCIKLLNLPIQISTEEIYDFCYGYDIIPGSVSLQHDKQGRPKGSATVVFGSRKEALTAIDELSGRPIGSRKIQLMFV